MNADLTHEELLVVARYWARQLDMFNLDAFRGEPLEDASPSEIDDAYKRLQTLAGLIGDETVRRVRAEVRKEHCNLYGPEVWDAMYREDDDLRAMLQQQYDDKRARIYCKEQDKETQRQAFEYLCDNPSGYQFDDSGDLWSFQRWDDGRRLVLTVRTVSGSKWSFPEYSIFAPWGWTPPFGLQS
ncbi:MAG: hypothetical protein JNM56_15130 [Planctomycetia bacterium]|nr:hypothetical protein [Planctomycetia bacterium]